MTDNQQTHVEAVVQHLKEQTADMEWVLTVEPCQRDDYDIHIPTTVRSLAEDGRKHTLEQLGITVGRTTFQHGAGFSLYCTLD
jgi:hypothetical protein